MTRAVLVTAALVAAVAVSTIVSLPPVPLGLDRAWSDDSVPGVLHIHTSRSDGRGSPDEIAEAAARAGVKFLVLTDHGDATRKPDLPAYRSGVLCMDAVEISTSGGHYVALDMGPAPYPLAGEPRDVVDDVHRFGGFGVAAHPDSPKAELRWNDWAAPIDGLEMINPDTSWRARLVAPGWRPRLTLFSALLAYPWRPEGAIANLLTESPDLEARWASLARRAPIVGLAGVDAHAKLSLRDAEPGDNRYSLPVPGYEASFRALSVHVTPSEPLSGDAAADAHRIMSGIRHGRLYVAVDAWASPPAFEFVATNERGTAREGEELAMGGPVTLRVRSNAPSSFATTLWRGSEAVSSRTGGGELTVTTDDQPAVYRVEITSPDRPGRAAWLISNPIYIRGPQLASTDVRIPPTTHLSLFDGHSTAGWTTEADPTSVAALDVAPLVSGPELRLRFGLAGGSALGQFAGAAVETHGVRLDDRVAFTVRAERPMRVSVQIRADVDGAAPDRWQRSVFIDQTARELSVAFADMRPVGTTHSPNPPANEIRAVMFVVDTTHTKPGASGRVWLKSVHLER